MGITKMKSKQLNNKGFSLLELIVVVAIIGVISGLVVVGVNVLGSADSKKMARSLYSDINLLKTQTLTVDGNWYMEVKYEGNKYKIDTYKETYVKDADGNIIDTTKTLVTSHTGGSKVGVKFIVDDSDTSRTYTVNEFNSVKISFRKDNGAFQIVEVDRVGAGAALDYYGKNKAGGSSDEIKGKFMLTSNTTSTVSEITLWYKTGRITSVN